MKGTSEFARRLYKNKKKFKKFKKLQARQITDRNKATNKSDSQLQEASRHCVLIWMKLKLAMLKYSYHASLLLPKLYLLELKL